MPAAPIGSIQGDVTIYHFPGLLGTLGWGWLHHRFLVLDHGAVLVYANENDWAEHQEPLDDIVLSPDSIVETTQEGGEVLVKLRCPGQQPLTFKGASEDGNSDGIDDAGPDSEGWRKALRREIVKLRRETGIGTQRQRDSSGPGGVSSWRVWNVFNAFVGQEAAAVEGSGGSDGGEGDDDSEEEVSFQAAFSEEEESEEEGREQEEKREVGGGGGGDGPGGGSSSERSTRRAKIGPVFRRWPLRRGGSNLHIPQYDSAGNLVNAAGSTAQVQAAAGTGVAGRGGNRKDSRGTVDGAKGAGGLSSLWKKVVGMTGQRDCVDCRCKWCKERGSESHSGHHPRQGMMRRSSSRYRHECSWTRERRNAPAKVEASPAGYRWEYLVGRWVPLQMARSGDVLGVRRFLERFPEFPDKNNLLRAAVRYKQYSLVEYMLEEQHMDVNIVNSSGIPLVWFSVAFMQRGDSGVMLRYLQQKGANIHTRNHAGQTVLFLLVSSRGKEAIPMLKYLVEEHGLSLMDKDNFGSRPLHWAVLYGHLETVQWISRYTGYAACRADWAKAFEQMLQVRMVRPEHIGAARSWRFRGLRKSARSLTPLGVAVLHNHEHIAKWLMGYGNEGEDCLSVKRNNLFGEANRDLALVAKTWPELLPEVLRGFERKEASMKNSWDTAEKRTVTPTGWSERKYDIKLLYGSPEVPANRSPLNILLSTNHPRLFETKAVQMVVALKWSVFGHRYYKWELGRYLFLSATFIMGFIIWVESANWVRALDSNDDRMPVIGGSVSRSLCWLLTLYNLLVEEGRELRASKSIRKYLESGWNLQSVLAYVLVLSLIPVFKPWQEIVEWEVSSAGFFAEYTTAGIVRRCLTAPAVIFLFTRLMEHLAVWKSTGIFIAVIRMVIAQTASWSVLFILFEVAFAMAFYALLDGNEGFETVWESAVSIFVMSMGEISLPFSDDEVLNVVAVLMLMIFMLIVAIVYLNLLVALMTSGYTEVLSRATAQAMMNRAAALVKWEGIMSDDTRKEAFSKVAPGPGKRSHITLTGWFSRSATEVFCNDEGATAVEPEQSTIDKRVDTHAAVMKELQDIRDTLEGLSTRNGGGFRRKAPGGESESAITSNDDRDASFRKRQAGMLDAQGKGLSALRLSGDGGSKRSGRGGNVRIAGTESKGSLSSVTTDEIQEWKQKARAVQKDAESRRGVIRAQALIRGYLSRTKSAPRFLPGTPDSDEE